MDVQSARSTCEKRFWALLITSAVGDSGTDQVAVQSTRSTTRKGLWNFLTASAISDSTVSGGCTQVHVARLGKVCWFFYCYSRFGFGFTDRGFGAEKVDVQSKRARRPRSALGPQEFHQITEQL